MRPDATLTNKIRNACGTPAFTPDLKYPRYIQNRTAPGRRPGEQLQEHLNG